MIESRKITDDERIVVSLPDSRRPLEVAAEIARRQAIWMFGIDDCGHSDKVKEWERSCCSMHIKFDSMEMQGGMTGWETTVTFIAWCEKHEDEDDE